MKSSPETTHLHGIGVYLCWMRMMMKNTNKFHDTILPLGLLRAPLLHVIILRKAALSFTASSAGWKSSITRLNTLTLSIVDHCARLKIFEVVSCISFSARFLNKDDDYVPIFLGCRAVEDGNNSSFYSKIFSLSKQILRHFLSLGSKET